MRWKSSILGIILCAYCTVGMAQQISVDNSQTPQQLVENHLIEGCVEVSNINSPVNGTASGLGSFGYFERAGSNFPFENGIVLTTGNALSAGNTQNTNVLNEGTPAWGTDADLENTLGISNTVNATTIEFDFISASNQVQFNYILASEEYFQNFPCLYSDGFAFLIRPSGSTAPYTNIALVPGTATAVNTTTIRPEITGQCSAQNEQYFQGYNVGDTNYNGRTTVLSATASIIPNTSYHIKLVIADQTDQNYDSAVFIEGASFNSIVELGDDISTCLPMVELDADINNPQATYEWFLDGAPLSGQNAPQLSANASGTYSVNVTVPLNGGPCTISDDVNVLVNDSQTPTAIPDLTQCNYSGGGPQETFNLDLVIDDAINSVTDGDYTISFHTSQADAQSGASPVSGNYQNTSNPQTIHIRIEENGSGCVILNTVDLVVNPLPFVNQPDTLVVCDDQVADGFTEIDLTQVDNEITGGQANLEVSYHYTQADADIGSNPIPMPYVNDNPNDMVFVSVQNTTTSCINTTTLDIEVLETPPVNTDTNHYIDACDSEYDGFSTFDLTSIASDIIIDGTNTTVTYHTTEADAESGNNPIADPSNFSNTQQDEQIVFIRIEDNTTGCISIVPIEVHSNLLLTGTNILNFSLCDEGNDGVEAFNLETIAETIAFDIPDLTISFYENEDDRDNQVNALDQSQEYFPPNNPQTIYIEISSPTCTEVSDLELSLDAIDTFPPIGDQLVCDEDQDGMTIVDLTQFDALATNNTDGFTVSYYLTEEDADSNLNQLPDFYSNTTNPFTVFTRVRSSATFCADINSFQITVGEAPMTNPPNNIVVCDDDQDGFSIVNLNSVTTDIIGSDADRSLSFFNTPEDAEANTNVIPTPEAYNAQTETLTVRVEDTNSGCSSLETLEVIVNTLPVFPSISPLNVCENDTDDFADFILNVKDDEIINGATDKQVLYFENPTDADTGNNPIDKDNAYQNTSNPQTIYVRVENLTDASCYGTNSFELNVGTNPAFTEPTDIFICDDMSNDTFETINLNDKRTEVLQGTTESVTITFYDNEMDAINGTNALADDYTNSVNPQEVFVKIDNGSLCASITSFAMTVVPVPIVNNADPFSQCDTDYDGSVNWDLTLAELNILDIRQDNIAIAYFENFDDIDSNSNPIDTPEDFDNTSNPQTVYIKVTNTVSDCYVALPIELIVNLPPAFNDFQTYEICDNEANTFNLEDINAVIVDDASDVEIVYYPTNQDAEDQTNPLDLNYTYTTNSDTIHSRLTTNSTGCFIVYPFQLIVNLPPVANMPEDMEQCDDDFDGFNTFDLDDQEASILGGQPASDYFVTYHESLEQANSGDNPLPLSYNAENGQTIFVRVENIATTCYSTTSFNTIVHPLPLIDIPTQTICPENFPLVVSAETGFDTDTYLWSTNEATSEIEIRDIGTYSVTVTTENGCSITSTFEVIESEPAMIDVVEVVDFSDPNNITVTISGTGDYLYQLDDFEPQESNIFENVGLGYHTLTIIDRNGCASVTKEILVIDAPKFFTPNDDGDFDTWHITGVQTLPGTIVYIFDRYGKLLKELPHYSRGWDGIYNGNKMPATDYWFSADVKRGDIAFTVKGHFALRR
ncbi:choice-of-anchor L domain-containing protein [Winogradskyella maritima]|uniref:Choice-of-anchor L domain-containing protein n=1 Tax=Winogradskyella maritima TaxID=1517766 RepID=A0ABV8AKI9_9FLAO|nr:choice-of-anchor L domain-containing protein [Winogradskyella maritima]